MANFKSVITDRGVEELPRILAQEEILHLVRAEMGDGSPIGLSPNTLSGLVNATFYAKLGGKQLDNGDLRIPTQITNEDIIQQMCIREVGVFALDGNGNEYLFAYAWTEDADDALNTISPPAPGVVGYNQIRIIDIKIHLDAIEYTSIEVKITSSALVTWSDVVGYAAQIIHRHTADQVDESVGTTVEQHQRWQDERLRIIEDVLASGTTSSVTVDIDTYQPLKWRIMNYNGWYDVQLSAFRA